MEKERNSKAKQTATKIGIIAAITLLLSIPLIMIKNVIEEREMTKSSVINEITESYGREQIVYAPYLKSDVVEENGADKESNTRTKIKGYDTPSKQLDYKAEVETETLHRSIYDVIVYNSKIEISGKFPVTDEAIAARKNEFRIDVYDIKGFSAPSQLTFGEQVFDIYRGTNDFVADVVLPEKAKAGDTVDFKISFELKGTSSLFFNPSLRGNTSLTISSPYPHPSFQGDILPNSRNVKDEGFQATWNVSHFNCSNHDKIGVKFVDPANPYQQSMRSTKYGMLIIILVFVAGMFVEFLTHKEINPVQYAVIGLSLALFYSLLLAFSELTAFGVAYMIAAAMTTGALTLYFRGILKERSAYVLGGVVAMVYALNYILLRLETYALLAGSLVLFQLLCVVMYFTADINNNKELTKTE